MTTDELAVLLEEVKNHPDDDVARLILADWLQDAGDPRGEFIHLQVRRHRLPADDPLRHDLDRREHHILRHHALRWIGPFFDHVRAWFFVRGLIVFEARGDRLLGAALDELAGSTTCPWIEELQLRDVHPGQLQRLAGSPLLGHLVALDLSDNHLAAGDLAFLLASPFLKRLRTLRLANNRLTSEAVAALAGCPHLMGLHVLDLARNPIGDAGAVALIESPHLGCLEQVTLSTRGLSLGLVIRLQEHFAGRLQVVHRRMRE